MKIPTEKEIQKEIKVLTEMKPKVRRWTYFGDDNWAAIEAQIDVLTRNLSEDDVCDEYDEENEEEGKTEYSKESALHACQWLTGEEKDPPSKGWKVLIEKKGKP